VEKQNPPRPILGHYREGAMTRKIRDLATIQTGYQFRGKIEPTAEGTHRVIQIKDFDDDNQLRPERLDPVVPRWSVDSFLVRPGDVLFLSRGHRPFAAALTEPLPDTFVSSYFFLVRPNLALIRPRFLAWAINVPLQSRLATLRQGSLLPQVSIADFGQLPIDLPPLDVQDSIVALDDLARRELRLAEAVARKRADLVRLACIRAARRGRPEGKDT
jgi:hypothetical protein